MAEKFPYNNLEFLGAGMYGKVYKATNSEGKKVAIKFLWDGAPETLLEVLEKNYGNHTRNFPESFTKQFQAEVDVLQKLNKHSKHVVKLIDSSKYGDLQYIVTQFVEQRGMDKRIQERRTNTPIIPEIIALEITKQFLEIVKKLHEDGEYLLDVQIKNYCIREIPGSISKWDPLRGLDLVILDWNGVVKQQGSTYTYAYFHDVWYAFAFLFEMLVGMRIPPLQSASRRQLRNMASSDWENITLTTRKNLVEILAHRVGQKDIKADYAIGLLEQAIKEIQDGTARTGADESQYQDIRKSFRANHREAFRQVAISFRPLPQNQLDLDDLRVQQFLSAINTHHTQPTAFDESKIVFSIIDSYPDKEDSEEFHNYIEEIRAAEQKVSLKEFADILRDLKEESEILTTWLSKWRTNDGTQTSSLASIARGQEIHPDNIVHMEKDLREIHEKARNTRSQYVLRVVYDLLDITEIPERNLTVPTELDQLIQDIKEKKDYYRKVEGEFETLPKNINPLNEITTFLKAYNSRQWLQGYDWERAKFSNWFEGWITKQGLDDLEKNKTRIDEIRPYLTIEQADSFDTRLQKLREGKAQEAEEQRKEEERRSRREENRAKLLKDLEDAPDVKTINGLLAKARTDLDEQDLPKIDEKELKKIEKLIEEFNSNYEDWKSNSSNKKQAKSNAIESGNELIEKSKEIDGELLPTFKLELGRVKRKVAELDRRNDQRFIVVVIAVAILVGVAMILGFFAYQGNAQVESTRIANITLTESIAAATATANAAAAMATASEEAAISATTSAEAAASATASEATANAAASEEAADSATASAEAATETADAATDTPTITQTPTHTATATATNTPTPTPTMTSTLTTEQQASATASVETQQAVNATATATTIQWQTAVAQTATKTFIQDANCTITSKPDIIDVRIFRVKPESTPAALGLLGALLPSVVAEPTEIDGQTLLPVTSPPPVTSPDLWNPDEVLYVYRDQVNPHGGDCTWIFPEATPETAPEVTSEVTSEATEAVQGPTPTQQSTQATIEPSATVRASIGGD